MSVPARNAALIVVEVATRSVRLPVLMASFQLLESTLIVSPKIAAGFLLTEL